MNDAYLNDTLSETPRPSHSKRPTGNWRNKPVRKMMHAHVANGPMAPLLKQRKKRKQHGQKKRVDVVRKDVTITDALRGGVVSGTKKRYPKEQL